MDTIPHMSPPRVLVIEDGEEYSRLLGRFLADGFSFVRAGDGPAALELLEEQTFDALFLDMRFDRAARDRLLGDPDEAAARFGGDPERARRFLEDNQGTYILAALREAGVALPVVFSYDFDGEPRRWRNLQQAWGPLSYLSDNAGPDQIRAALRAATAG